MGYVVRDASGKILKPGDRILDCVGVPAHFMGCDAPDSVLAQIYPFRRTFEYSPKTFNLTITEEK